jgi:hypothetical protein
VIDRGKDFKLTPVYFSLDIFNHLCHNEFMKVIFLDIDGVICTDCKTFNPECLDNLKHILDKVPDAVMVLSSCWRHGFIDWLNPLHSIIPRNEVIETMETWFVRGGWTKDLSKRLIDSTPTLGGDHRGSEISEWLKKHPDVSQFCILDDDSDMEPLMDHLVQTNGEVGLTLDDAEKAISKLSS